MSAGGRANEPPCARNVVCDWCGRVVSMDRAAVVLRHEVEEPVAWCIICDRLHRARHAAAAHSRDEGDETVAIAALELVYECIYGRRQRHPWTLWATAPVAADADGRFPVARCPPGVAEDREN